MGKTGSKSAVNHQGDPQVRIINTQSVHTEALEKHEVIICIILIVVVLQLILSLYKIIQHRQYETNM